MWTVPEAKGISRPTQIEDEKIKLVSEGCDTGIVSTTEFCEIHCPFALNMWH